MPDLALDYDPQTGIVRSGRFVGHHVNDVMKYLETLEDSVNNLPKPEAQNPPPAAPPPRKEGSSPEDELAMRSASRIQGIEALTAATMLRQEQDDEESFAATVPDYENFRERIAEIKKNTPPHIRVQRGFHRGAYLFLKAQDPEMQKKLLGIEEPPAVDEGEDPGEEPPAPPVEEPPAPQQSEPPAPPAPRPVPPRAPAAKPTPAPRNNPPQQAKPRLKATPKIEKLAASFGMSTDAYLKQLEDRGFTQSQLDDLSAGRQTSAGTTYRRSVYNV
jgi:hypothetical protein